MILTVSGSSHRADGSFYRRHGKRAFDLIVAVPALIVLSPVMAGVAVVIRIRLGPPCLFRQTRGGWRGEPFDLVKFRTMTEARGGDGALLPDGERLTHVGAFLRALSLDELPELVNVVRGEMSLVGPRPFIYDYMPLYSQQHRRRHDVRPGMTGLAQVMGRNGLAWERRFELDLEYIETMSLAGDIRIIARTAGAVLRRHGINQGRQVPSERFDRANATGEDA